MNKKTLPISLLQMEEDNRFIPEISSGMFIFMTNHEIVASHCKPRHLQSSKFIVTEAA